MIGLLILLVLIVGSGALAFVRLGAFEQEVRFRSQTNARHLRSALELQELCGRLNAEVTTYTTALAVGAVAFPARNRVHAIERDIAARIKAEDVQGLSALAEWPEFTRAYRAYESHLDAMTSDTDETKRLNVNLETALHDLAVRIRRDSEQLDEDSKAMRVEAQRDVLLTTGICFIAGLAISILAFTETRRRIAIIENALVELVGWQRFTQGVLDGMDSGVLTVDDQGLVTSANGPALYALAINEEAMAVGKSLAALVEDHERLREVIAPVTANPPSERRYLGRVELGRGGWLFDVGASPLAMGGRRGFILTLSDVTEAERANGELRRNRALAAVGQMTAQVAHEIKNPLGGVRLAAQVLERRLKGDDQSMELVRRIENSVDHLARTVSELNQFARPNELRLQPVSTVKLLEELLAMVGDKVVAKNITVETSFDAALGEGTWDEGELRKAFINFLVNALEASPENARLWVLVERRLDDGESAVVTIRDEGSGMSDETLRRLFEPFYTTKTQGTGLGMSIARKIIELHRGTLDVRSREGEGTTVVVVLPLAPVAVATPVGKDA